MHMALRVIIIIGALYIFTVISRNIKRSKIQMSDSIFWIILATLLVIVAVFPQIVVSLSQALGFVSPSNFVWMCAIGILLMKVFSNAAEISMLKHKIEELTQESALKDERASSQSKDE